MNAGGVRLLFAAPASRALDTLLATTAGLGGFVWPARALTGDVADVVPACWALAVSATNAINAIAASCMPACLIVFLLP